MDGAQDRQNKVVRTVSLVGGSGDNKIIVKVPQVERWTRNGKILLRFWEGSCRVGGQGEVLYYHLLMMASDGEVHEFGGIGERFRP